MATRWAVVFQVKALRNGDLPSPAAELLQLAAHLLGVLGTRQAGEVAADIGSDVYDDVDQFIRIEKEKGKAVLNGKEYPLKDGSAVVIPAGVERNIINTSAKEDLRL